MSERVRGKRQKAKGKGCLFGLADPVVQFDQMQLGIVQDLQ